MAQLIIVSWRDIPAQIIVKKNRKEQHKHVLSERFEKAIDRAAMRGRAADTDSYLEEWKRNNPIEVSDNLEEEARLMAGKIEAEFTEDYLNKLVENKGYKPD